MWGGGGGEAEAGARRRRGGGGAAAPRRPRAAVINDAFPRPHANFQIFYSKSCFWMFNWWAFGDLINSKACTNVYKLLNLSDLKKVAKTFSKNAIYPSEKKRKAIYLFSKVISVPMSYISCFIHARQAEKLVQVPYYLLINITKKCRHMIDFIYLVGHQRK